MRKPFLKATLFLLLTPLIAIAGDWPPVKKGTWELQFSRTLPNGKVENSTRTVTHCEDATSMFQAYGGTGIIEKWGCSFAASQVSENVYRVVSKCEVRDVKDSITELKITLHGKTAFEMEIQADEDHRHYIGKEMGRLVADCPKSKE